MKERKHEDMPIEEFPTVNLPHVDAPIGDPPVPNRAHTEMRLATELDTLSEIEKAQMYFKKTSLE